MAEQEVKLMKGNEALAHAAAAPAEPEVKSGRSVDELMGRLNLMKY